MIRTVEVCLYLYVQGELNIEHTGFGSIFNIDNESVSAANAKIR